MFNLALNPPFCQTAVSTSPFFSVVFIRCHFVSVLVRWLGGSFAKLGFSIGLCGFANVPPKVEGIYTKFSIIFFCSFFSSTNSLDKAFTTFHIKTGGTAFPIARYCLLSDTLSNLKVVGND